jgi:hypothetical protein
VTIAGQTAPGDGVGFYNNFFRISGDDVVIRHLRFRHGKYGSGGDCIDLDSGCLNAILDHVSMQFSTDENMSSFGSPPENLTLQYSLNAWGLESHSCGGLWDQNHATSHHNLWAHNHTRNPKARPNGLLEWVNNVTFDWDIGFIMGDTTSVQSYKSNVINNYFICPPGNIRNTPLEKAGLLVKDVEILPMHYAYTLRHWRERFVARKAEAVALYDEQFFRMWEFYLAGSEMGFRWDELFILQIQIAKNQFAVPDNRNYIERNEAKLKEFEATRAPLEKVTF